jgi:hypothetical protein
VFSRRGGGMCEEAGAGKDGMEVERIGREGDR